MKEGDTVSVTATDEAGNKSDATTATVVKASDKAKDADGIKEPATKTPVKDTSTLTEDEKGKVKSAVLEIINIMHPTEEALLEDCKDIDDRRPGIGKH